MSVITIWMKSCKCSLFIQIPFSIDADNLITQLYFPCFPFMVAYLSLLRFYLVMFISVCAKLIRLGDMEDMRRSILFRWVIWQALRWTSASSFGRWGMKEMRKKGLLFVMDSLTHCMGPISAHSIPNQITWIGCCHVCGTPCSPSHFDCSCIISFRTITEAHFSAQLTHA